MRDYGFSAARHVLNFLVLVYVPSFINVNACLTAMTKNIKLKL